MVSIFDNFENKIYGCDEINKGLIISKNGSILLFGFYEQNEQYKTLKDLNNVSIISSDGYFVVVVCDDGKIITCGSIISDKRMNNMPDYLNNVDKIIIALHNVCFILEDKSMVIIGDNCYGICDLHLTNVKDIIFYGSGVVVLFHDGKVRHILYHNNQYFEYNDIQTICDCNNNNNVCYGYGKCDLIVGIKNDGYIIVIFSNDYRDESNIQLLLSMNNIKKIHKHRNNFIVHTTDDIVTFIRNDGNKTSYSDIKICSHEGNNNLLLSNNGIIYYYGAPMISNCILLKNDGTITYIGPHINNFPDELNNVIFVKWFGSFGVVVKSDGIVVVFGDVDNKMNVPDDLNLSEFVLF